MRSLAAAVALLAVLRPPISLAEPQSPAQQRCITRLNRGGAEIAAAAGRALERCVRLRSHGLLAAERTIVECAAADPGGRIGRLQHRPGRTAARNSQAAPALRARAPRVASASF